MAKDKEYKSHLPNSAALERFAASLRAGEGELEPRSGHFHLLRRPCALPVSPLDVIHHHLLEIRSERRPRYAGGLRRGVLIRTGGSSALLGPNDDRHVAVEAAHTAQQPFERELVDPARDQRRYIRLLEAETLGRLRLRQPEALDDVANFADKLRLQQFFLRPIKTEVGEDIAAAALDRDSFCREFSAS